MREAILDRLRAVWPTLSEREKQAILRELRGNRPPPASEGEFAPEQFWEHSAYLNAPGSATFRDCTFGPKWLTKPTTHYSQWGVEGSVAGQTITDKEWGAWGGDGLAHAVMNWYGPAQGQILMSGCAWLAHPKPEGGPSNMRWGVRAFGVGYLSTTDGAYTPAPVVFNRCAFSRGMGAAVQIALRANEAHGNIWPSGHHVLERCVFTGIGDPKSERWGAFTISEHNPEGYGASSVPVDISILDCSMTAGHVNYLDSAGKLVRSPRGILVQGRRNVTISGLDMRYPDPHDGWAMQLWDCDEVRIVDSHVEEGRIELRNCKKVTVEGCTGDAYLAVGTHSDPAKPFPMAQVTYQGPLTTGYSHG